MYLKEWLKNNPLKFGDMILTTNVDWKGYKWYMKPILWIVYNLIRLVSGSQYVHVTMYIGKGKFASVEPPKAKEIKLDNFINKKILIRRRDFVWTKNNQKEALIYWRSNYKGSYYDLTQLISILWHWMKRIPRDKYKGDAFKHFVVCSTIFCLLERKTGVNTFLGIHSDRVNPGDCERNKYYNHLVLSKKGKVIKEFK